MNIRFSHWATGALVVAAVALMADRCWAVFYGLGPSKDEWGLKYDVQVSEAEGEMLDVVFTLADEGRLTPVYSFTVVAFSDPDRQGSRTYKVKVPLELKTTENGQRAAQVQIRQEFLDRAMIRVLTQTVDGKRQTAGAAYYDIPLKKFVNKVPEAASRPAPASSTTPSKSKVTK